MGTVDRDVELTLVSLAVPPVGASFDEICRSPSVRLFVEHAERADARFRLDAGTAESVAEVCRRLGGLSLAIELAAAHVRLLSPAHLERRLSASVSHTAQLDLLTPPTSGARAGIRDALTSTRTLLTPTQDDMFLRLAGFCGPFPLDAVAAVTGGSLAETLDDLDALVGLRLVEPISQHGDDPLFAMLPIVRSFGREASALAGDRGDRRREYIRTLTRDAAAATALAARSDAIARAQVLRRDIADQVHSLARTDAAAAAALAVDAAPLLEGFEERAALGAALEGFIASRAVRWFERRIQAGVWLWASSLLAHSPDGREQRELVRERWLRGIHLVDDADQPLLAIQARRIALSNMAVTGDFALAAQAASEGRRIAQAAALSPWIAWFDVWSGIVAVAKGDVANALALAIRGLERGQRVGDARVIAAATGLLRTLPAGSVPDDVPVPSLEQALELSRGCGDVLTETFLLSSLTHDALVAGDPEIAAQWCAQRLEFAQRSGWVWLNGMSVLHAMLIGTALGDAEFATRMAGAVRSDEERLLRSMVPATRALYADALAQLRSSAGAPTYSRRLADGGMLSMADASTEAIAWLRAHRSRRAAPGAAPSVTRREQQVLALLATGLTNKQIAARLGVSAKTVMHHSVAIYRKLGVRGRAEATAYAIRHDLLAECSASGSG